MYFAIVMQDLLPKLILGKNIKYFYKLGQGIAPKYFSCLENLTTSFLRIADIGHQNETLTPDANIYQ